MASLLQDVRYGIRLLFRNPGFTVVATLVLALGIGANTAVFGLVNSLLLKPLVGRPDGAVVGIYSKDRTQPDTYRAFSYPSYADLRARTDVFASVTAHNFAMAGITEGDSTRRAFINIVTANFFDTFGARLALGRTFTPDEEKPGADIPVTILSDGAWRRLGADPQVLGRTIQLNARAFTVIGVAPRGFGGSMALVTPELWVPTGVYDTITNDFIRNGMTTTLADRRHNNLIVVARLHPGVTLDAIAPRLDAIGADLERAYPAENKNQSITAAALARMSVSTSPQTDGALAGVTIALLSMSGLVLLIASLNLANMLLARSGARRKEFAIRLAIGGSRGRIVRQLMTEGFLLSLAGGAGGLVLAWWTTSLLAAMLTPISPVALSFDAAPDARVFAAMLGFCTLSTIMFGLFPAWKLARTDAVPELKDQAGELSRGRRSRWSMQNVLVMGQLAFSLVMLTVAGLFMRGAVLAAGADPGFSFERGILIQVDSSLAGYDDAKSRAFQARLLERVRIRGDVAAASLASIMPFGEISTGGGVQKAGAPIPRHDPRADRELVSAEFTSIGADYFKALSLTLVAGRDFTRAEETTAAGTRVAIIDEPLARQLFGQAALGLGQHVQYAPREDGQPPVVLEVVGVAPGLRHTLFDAGPVPHLYMPLGQEFQSGVYLHIRTSAPSAQAESALLPDLRQSVHAAGADVPILAIETLSAYRDRNLMLSIVRLGASIFVVFGGVALFLAAVGVYGVKAYVVSRRTREIGIRMALGATPGRVVRMVLRDGMVLGAAGIAAGALLSILAGFGMRSLTYQGRGFDSLVLGGALMVLAAAAFTAGWLPARRATRIQPIRALRAD